VAQEAASGVPERIKAGARCPRKNPGRCQVSQKESRPVPGSVKEGGGAQEYQKESRPVPGSVKEERRSTEGRVLDG
jgi:hypothetical protein